MSNENGRGSSADSRPPRGAPRGARPILVAVCALGALAALGCAYARDRGRDALDVFRLEVGYGIGLEVDARATDLAAVGLGGSYTKRVGLRDGSFGVGQELALGLPVAPFLWGAASENGTDLPLPPAHLAARVSLRDLTWPRPVGRSQAEGSLLFPFPLGATSPARPLLRRADLEVAATAVVVSVRAGFSPGELLDLIAGLFGLDPAGDDDGAALEPATAEEAEPGAAWLAADFHVHASPPDAPGHVRLTPEESVALARSRGVEAIVLSPHFWGGSAAQGWRFGGRASGPAGIHTDPERSVERVMAAWADLERRAREAAAGSGTDADGAPSPRPSPRGERENPIVIVGWEEGYGFGHFDCFGADMGKAIAAAEARGVLPAVAALDLGVVILNHPFLRPLRFPFGRTGNVPDFDPWGVPDARPPEAVRPLVESYHGAEAFNAFVDLAECAFLLPPEDRSVERVLRKIEADILAQRRRIAPVGGCDNHHGWIFPACWVLARERSPEAVIEAVRAGRVVLVRPHAASFAARTDLEPAWHAVGAALAARERVELRWRGRAELFIDGASAGAHRGGFVHEIGTDEGSFHIYRIVRGESRSAWIYVNLPAPR